MTYAEIWARSVDQAFIAQVKVGIVKAAIAISAEAAETTNHTNRVTFARSVLLNPQGYAENMSLGVATDDTVQVTPSDANIYNAIAGQWNAYAGMV